MERAHLARLWSAAASRLRRCGLIAVMATNARQIEFLARAIVNRLEDRGLVEFGDAEAGIEIVARILEEHLRAAEAEDRSTQSE
jgi:hypothetical protein